MLINHPLFMKYFRPRAFEYAGHDSVYRYIGIRWFKKYLPTSGDRVRRHAKQRLISYQQEDPFASLYAYVRTTRVHEYRHWLGMLAFIALAFVFDYTAIDYVVVTVLFLVINVYPILLQRHNRVRILKLLNRFNQPSPYEQ
jgi:glycosyl-4,4'-diaponeurosporenoate acyltransferase